MKLGIIGAMEQEVETLLAQMEDKVAAKKAGSTFYEGKLAGLDADSVAAKVKEKLK